MNMCMKKFVAEKIVFCQTYWVSNLAMFRARVQARGRLRRNTRPHEVNFALEGSGGEKTSYETSPHFSWREKSLLPKFLSQLEP